MCGTFIIFIRHIYIYMNVYIYIYVWYFYHIYSNIDRERYIYSV